MTRPRKSRPRWDHKGLEVLRNYCPPPDESTPVGWRCRVGTEWFAFGEIVGDQVILVDDDGKPFVFPLSEVFRAWDPELDPYVFEELRKAS